MGLDMNVPFDVTWSCYWDRDIHCGTCVSCRERREASPRWASRTPSPTKPDARLAQNLRRAAGFRGRSACTRPMFGRSPPFAFWKKAVTT